jgi:hypothetical protein
MTRARISMFTPRTALAARASMACTNPSEGRVPVSAAITSAQRSTGTWCMTGVSMSWCRAPRCFPLRHPGVLRGQRRDDPALEHDQRVTRRIQRPGSHKPPSSRPPAGNQGDTPSRPDRTAAAVQEHNPARRADLPRPAARYPAGANTPAAPSAAGRHAGTGRHPGGRGDRAQPTPASPCGNGRSTP